MAMSVWLTNDFDFALGFVLSQPRENNLLHLVGFHSCKFSLVDINYEIHDKELLAIMDAFEQWHHLLEGVQHEIIMYFDHKNLQYFMTIPMLNQRQTLWALSLFQFWFVITYHLGQQQGKPNVLSRCSYLTPKEGDAPYNQQCDTILKPENLQLQALSIILKDKSFLHRIREYLINDSLIFIVRNYQKNVTNDFNKFEFCDGLLYHDKLLYVSEGLVQIQVL